MTTTTAPTSNGHHRTDPRKIENLHEHAQHLLDRIRYLQEQQLDELDLLLAEATRRRI